MHACFLYSAGTTKGNIIRYGMARTASISDHSDASTTKAVNSVHGLFTNVRITIEILVPVTAVATKDDAVSAPTTSCLVFCGSRAVLTCVCAGSEVGHVPLDVRNG